MSTANTMTDFDKLHDYIDQWLIGVLPLPTLKTQLEAAIDDNADALAARVSAYQGVLTQLIIRIEGAASFTEESCSFSQGDFAGSLHDWLGKLEARLKAV
jgi:hypothetical protein